MQKKPPYFALTNYCFAVYMGHIRHYKAILHLILLCSFAGKIKAQLPILERAQITPLLSENDPTRFCYEALVQDQAGRLWMKTCGVAEKLYGIRVFQFDGYDRWPISIARDEWQDYNSIYLCGFSSLDQWYGFYSDPEGQSTIFSYDIITDAIQYTDIPAGNIHGIIEYQPGKFWVLGKEKKDYIIYHWQDTSIQFRYSFPHYDQSMPDYSNEVIMNFEYSDSTFFVLDGFLPLVIYDIPTKSSQTYTLDDFGKLTTKWLTDEKIGFNGTRLKVRDSIIYIAQGHAGPPFFQLNTKNPEAGPQIYSNLPDSTQARSIWEDEQGNLLFLYDYPNSPSKKFGAFLLDTADKIYDYSSVVASLSIIRSIHGKDFKQAAFIGTATGAFFVQVHEKRKISTNNSLNALRYIRQNGTEEVIIRARNTLFRLQDEELTKLPDEHCFAKVLESDGKKEILGSPDGKVWILNQKRLTQYTASEANNCLSYTLKFAVHTGIFITKSKLALVEEYTRKLVLYDLGTQQEISISGPPVIFRGRIHYLWASDETILWAASNNGLYKVDLNSGEWKRYGDTPDFEDHRILTIHEDRQGQLWLGTASRGIHIFNPKSEKVELVINESGGLSNNVVVGILEDDEGDIWAATYNGLNLLQSDGTILTVLGEKDGLTHQEFNRYAHFKSDDGRLFFGAVEGLNIIQPKELKAELKATEATKIFATSLSYFDQEANRTIQLRNYIPTNQAIILPADKRFLSVNVGLSNYGLNNKNRFAYRFEGRQDDWTYLGNEHLIRLSSLPPGKYDLLIKGIDHNGNWSSNAIRIPIHAKEFFYKQTWFYVLCAIPFLVFAFLWISRLRSEKIRLEQEVDKRTLEIRKDKELIQQQAEELQQLDQMKSRFFANISHDLRTPITLISGPAELLVEEDYVKEKSALHKAILTIGQNSKKLLRLIDEILDLARLESRTIKLKEEPIPVVAFTQSIFESYHLEAQRKKLQFQYTHQVDADFQILIDPNRLEKILNNLLSNALKFTAPGDAVQLNVFRETDQIIFEVADTGRGIPEADLPHIFERYFQSKDEKLVQTSGSGIGLSLCQEFAKLMNGQLSVKSDFGKGSVFRLSVPVKQSQEESNWQKEEIPFHVPQNIPASTENGSTKERPRIMVVEDNTDVQSFLKSLLETDYQVFSFDDGQYALDFLKENTAEELPVDVILSDINMPRLDGYGLIDAIKQHERWQQLPMIMLTARLQERSKIKALRMGVDDYLTKPFSPVELKVRLQNILENYQNRLSSQKAYLDVNPTFEPTISADQAWLQELEEHAINALDAQIELTNFFLAEQMSLSTRQLSRKVKQLTGLTVGKYVHEVKLQKARHLLEQKAYPTVAEVGYACGFNSHSYFTKIFNRHFGKSPASYY